MSLWWSRSKVSIRVREKVMSDGKIILDGVEVPFEQGENIIDAARRIGVDVPHYCYHKGLSVVAQCRMCLVKVEGARKLATGCSTPCQDGMQVSLKDPEVKEAVAGVQEFLLANHPLDCPICDQAGECSLQNYSLKHGAADSRYEFHRRTFMDVDMGPVIKKNMNRCIHCTRCIRYCDEIGGAHEMLEKQRGNSTEIVTIDDRPLHTPYAGGLADVCPVGSLTSIDFRFRKRVWYLKTADSVCDGCSKGCNIMASHENSIVYRLEPKENLQVNQYWMCDEGRFGFHHIYSPSRILGPSVKAADSRKGIVWPEASTKFRDLVNESDSLAVFAAADITNEEAQLLKKEFAEGAEFFSYSPTVNKSSEDEALDHLLRRKDKSPNMKGLEDSGFSPASQFDPKKFDLVIFVSAGKVRIPYGLAQLAKNSVAIGVFMKEESLGYDLVLPGFSTLEKSGSFVNHDGIRQSFEAAIPPIGHSKPLAEILNALFEVSSRKVS